MISRYAYRCDKAEISITWRVAGDQPQQLVITRDDLYASGRVQSVTLEQRDELVALYLALKQIVDDASR